MTKKNKDQWWEYLNKATKIINPTVGIAAIALLWGIKTDLYDVGQKAFQQVEDRIAAEHMIQTQFTAVEKWQILEHVNAPNASFPDDYLSVREFDSIIRVLSWNVNQVRVSTKKNKEETIEIRNDIERYVNKFHPK